MRNAIKGKGFRSNDAVLDDFVVNGDYEGALKYFNLKQGKVNTGTVTKDVFGEELIDVPEYSGKTNIKTGEIEYSPRAFSKNYDYLKATTYKEGFHQGRSAAYGNNYNRDLYLEEVEGFQYLKLNSYRYPKAGINYDNQIRYYQGMSDLWK